MSLDSTDGASTMITRTSMMRKYCEFMSGGWNSNLLPTKVGTFAGFRKTDLLL